MYGKIFERMFTGTMYGSGPVVFAVWAYVIACARPPGVITLNQKLLAATIGCSTEEIRAAIEFLMRPDAESDTTDDDGRRLVHIRGLDYHVVSWQKYRDIRDEEERREYQRNWVAAKRAKLRGSTEIDYGRQNATESDNERQESTEIDSRQESTKSTKAEAEAVKRVGKESSSRERGSRLSIESLPDEWRQWAEAERPALDPVKAFDRFRDHWAAQPGAKGRKTDWAATWRNWVRNERPGVDAATKSKPYEKPEWLQNIL